MMQQAQLPMRQRRIMQQNNLERVLSQMQTISIQIDSLKSLIKTITGTSIPKRFMYHVGGAFVKQKGDTYYKTVQNEISTRIAKKKQLKSQSQRLIVLIISLTKKQEERLLSPITAQAIEQYKQQLQDLNDMN